MFDKGFSRGHALKIIFSLVLQHFDSLVQLKNLTFVIMAFATAKWDKSVNNFVVIPHNFWIFFNNTRSILGRARDKTPNKFRDFQTSEVFKVANGRF